MTLSRSRWAEKQRVFMLGDEGACSEIEDQAPIHLLIEVEVEVIERRLWIAELGFFSSTLQQPVTSSPQFIGNEAREQVDGCHGFGLSLLQTSFDEVGDAAEWQLPQRAFEFNHVRGSCC